jgi:hypothetical protein
MNTTPIYPRSLRPAPDPLALYLRPARNDHRIFSDLLAAGDASFFGAVLDPTRLKRHGELREQILRSRIDAVLDPRTQESATPGGYTDALGKLPWGMGRPHNPTDFTATQGKRIILAIADFVCKHGVTQVIAPTHLLQSADDPWLTVDIEATQRLRDQLDRKSAFHIPIIYSLAVPYSVFRNREQRHKLIHTLKKAPASQVWLSVAGLGSDASPTAVRNYIEAAGEFHALGIPIVSDHMGGMVGLSLLAFGAVGGLVHGITFGERFHTDRWRVPSQNRGFMPARRVYVPEIDLLLKPKQAEALLTSSSRARSIFGCKDTHCCPRGIKDMLSNPARHFMVQRIKEIAGLSQIPEQLRPQRFLEKHLRPATDLAVAAAGTDWQDPAMAVKTQKQRKRLDALRIALGDEQMKRPSRSFALHPNTRAVREVRG